MCVCVCVSENMVMDYSERRMTVLTKTSSNLPEIESQN
jgi:hypothetical protein